MTTHFYATYEKDMLSPATTRFQHNKGSPEGSTKSTPTSSNDLREHGIEPTEDVAEWCHQMHITQRRQYWWCAGCVPKSAPLHVPSQQTLHSQDSRRRPGHAYQ